MPNPQILVVDDSPEIRLSAAFILEDQGFDVLEAENHHYAQTALSENRVDLILLDMNFSLDTTSGEEGLRFLTWLSKSDFVIPVIAMTGWSNVDLAVSAMRLGACDFIEKPWNNQRLIQIIRQQLKMAGLQVQNQKLKQQLEPKTEQDFIWRSPAMAKHRPTQLSGGQQQCIAIARALVADPSILLVDEPTGNLDSKSSDQLMATLEALNKQGTTLCVVTHDIRYAEMAKRKVYLLDGQILGQTRRGN